MSMDRPPPEARIAGARSALVARTFIPGKSGSMALTLSAEKIQLESCRIIEEVVVSTLPPTTTKKAARKWL